MLLVYQQLYNTLSVYLRDNHSINPQGYGVLLTTSAVTVILLQFWVTRRIKYRPAFFMMAFGALFYVIGYGMFGFDPLPGLQFTIPIYRWSLLLTGTFAWFMFAVVIITMGEMVVVPTSQALAANFAPEDMRGRYMAMFGFSWGVPAIVGPAAAGYVLDNYNPNLLWYLCAALCMISVFGYYFLHLRLGAQARFQPRLDEGHMPASAD
jgi:MFS family permease